MNHTDNYGLRKPENNEYISIDDLNYNTDKIDAVLQEKVNSYDGDISNTIIGVLEESTEEFPVPAVKEKTRVFFGKVRKFIQDFNDFKTGILTVGMIINNAVTDNSNLPVSAAVAKALQDQLTQLNSDFTSGYFQIKSDQIEFDVPTARYSIIKDTFICFINIRGTFKNNEEVVIGGFPFRLGETGSATAYQNIGYNPLIKAHQHTSTSTIFLWCVDNGVNRRFKQSDLGSSTIGNCYLVLTGFINK